MKKKKKSIFQYRDFIDPENKILYEFRYESEVYEKGFSQFYDVLVEARQVFERTKKCVKVYKMQLGKELVIDYFHTGIPVVQHGPVGRRLGNEYKKVSNESMA